MSDCVSGEVHTNKISYKIHRPKLHIYGSRLTIRSGLHWCLQTGTVNHMVA